MTYRRLGRSGVKVSAVGLGTWLTFGRRPEQADALVDAAFDAGINWFDTANTDGQGRAEELLGRALARHPADDRLVATKVWGPMGGGPNQRGLSRKHLRSQCEASLRRLGVETIDLYQCQRHDPETMLDETISALDDLVHQGKIHYWGLSGWPADAVRNVVTLADAQRLQGPTAMQVRYNVLDRDAETTELPLARQLGLAPLAYAPLAQGVLTGKYADAVPPESRLADERLGRNLRERYGAALGGPAVQAARAVAAEHGLTPAQVALAWLLRPGGATAVVAGASTPAQVRENAVAAEVALDAGALDRLTDSATGGT